MSRRSRRTTLAATAVVAVGLATAASASAVTRYAAPGGTQTPAGCTSPAGPYCSIGTAAGGTGVVLADEAVILPGDYSDTAGDLNGDTGNPTDGTVQTTAGSVHGVVGEPRPVVTIDNAANAFGAFSVAQSTLSHVTIDTAAANVNFSVSGTGVIDGVIALNSKNGSNVLACNQSNGTVRNTVCLTSGSGATALGASLGAAGTFSPQVRGVTAVSTGANSFGMQYFYSTFSPPMAPTVTVTAKSVIAQGTQVDVRARATVAPTSVTINLDHSNFDTSDTSTATGGVASVTAPGTNFNVVVPALLAADGYHQLAGSPTINAGITDGSSGTTDIDGQGRQIGIQPADIGADERGVQTTTSVSCIPASVTVGSPTTCTATVAAAAEFILGTVSFGSSAAGAFSASTCSVSGMSPQTQCSVTFTPSAAASHSITGTYSGGPNHDGSQGSGALTATDPPITPIVMDPVTNPPVTNPPVTNPPGSTLPKCPKGKKPKKVKGKTKCVKKKRKKK